jgi:excinuclease ABC subunit C
VLRIGIRETAPKQPGVYAMLDQRQRVIYVGKAKCLRSRLLSYFRTKSRDPKAGRILRYTRAIVWEHATDEFASLLRELELIQTLRPRFNVLGMPGTRRYFYVTLSQSPAPHVHLVKRLTGKEHHAYGPFVRWRRAQSVARRLNDFFQLRDCPKTIPLMFADQPDLFPADRGPLCIRHDLGTCLGPCAGLCERDDYANRVAKVRAFLDGTDRSLIKRITKEMLLASEKQDYETAAVLRDKLEDFQWIEDRLTLLRKARKRGSYVYPIKNGDGHMVWYAIHRGQVRAVVFAPRSSEEHAVCKAVLRRVFAETAAEVLSSRGVDSVLFVASWLRKHPSEKKKLLQARRVLEKLADQ